MHAILYLFNICTLSSSYPVLILLDCSFLLLLFLCYSLEKRLGIPFSSDSCPVLSCGVSCTGSILHLLPVDLGDAAVQLTRREILPSVSMQYIREANVPNLSIHPHAPRPLATWEGAQAATMRCFTAWELTVMHHTR